MYTVFVKRGCLFCKKSLATLRKQKVKFTKIVCKDQSDLKDCIKQHHFRVPKVMTFPRIYKDSKLIGGSDDLEKHRFFD